MKKLIALFLLFSFPAFAQAVNGQYVSGLPQAGTLTGAELVAVDQAGITVQTTMSSIRAGAGAPGGSPNYIQYNAGTSFGGISPSTSGYVLTSNGVSSVPSFQSIGVPAFISSSGYTAATLAARFGHYINVQDDCGVLYNGSDQTTNLNSCEATANAAGLCMIFPTGTVTGTMIFNSNDCIMGLSGPLGQTTIKQPNTKNAQAVLYSNGSAALWGSNSTGGVGYVYIANITIDGNKANNTGGDCLDEYGYASTWMNISAKNCPVYMFRSEWGPGGDPTYGMQDYYINLVGDTSGEDGFYFGGPHDSQGFNITLIDAGLSTNNTYSGLNVYGNGNGIFYALHPWRRTSGHDMKYSLYEHSIGGVRCIGCFLEGADTADVFFTNNNNEISGGSTIYPGAVNISTTYGLSTIGQENIVSAYFECNPNGSYPQVAIQLGQSGNESTKNLISGSTASCTGGVVDWTYSNGNNNLNLTTYNSGTYPTPWVGSPLATDYYNLRGDGAGGGTVISSQPITLGTSATATNPSRSGDLTTGLYSAAASTVSIAAGGSDVADITTYGETITGGTLPTTKNALNITGTLTSSAVTERGIQINITSAGSGSNTDNAFQTSLLAGYTGSGSTRTYVAGNSALGTANNPYGGSVSTGNFSYFGSSIGNGTGANIGGGFFANQSQTVNVGAVGAATSSTASPPLNIGMVGNALNATKNVGGMFFIGNSAPTYSSSAGLISDNGASSNPIFIAQANGAAKVTIGSTGMVGIGTTLPANLLYVNNASGSASFAGAAIVADNSGGGNTNISLAVSGTRQGSIRVDGSGNLVFNAASGNFYFGNDFGGTPFFNFVGNLAFYESGSPYVMRIGNNTPSNGSYIQMFGNTSSFPGQMYFDAGATSGADEIFRTGASTTERLRIAYTGNIGIGSSVPRTSLDDSQNVDAMILPIGTTGQRPATPVNGMIRYNSTSTPTIEGYINNAWTAIPGSGGGGGTVYLGTSASANNPQINGDATTGLYSASTSTVSVATGGAAQAAFSPNLLLLGGSSAYTISSQSAAVPPTLNIIAGNSTSGNNPGGSLNITTGNASGTGGSSYGGNLQIFGGLGSGTGPGGTALFEGGTGGQYGNGGDGLFYAGPGGPDGGDGGIFEFNGGDTSVVSGLPGALTFFPGSYGGSGSGQFQVYWNDYSNYYWFPDQANFDSLAFFNVGLIIPVIYAADNEGTLVVYNDGVPVLTSCGTSPAISGNDNAGTITEGSIATGCVITFSHVKSNAPHCLLTSESGLVFSYSQTTSAITMTNVGALSSTKLDYWCPTQ